MPFDFKKMVTALLLSTAAVQAQYTEEINTNRPGLSMGAFAVGKTVFQVETGINGTYEDHDVLNYDSKGIAFDLALRYGAFLEQLEFVLDMQYRFDQYNDALYSYNRNDFKNLTFGAKYLIYDPDKYYTPERNVISWHASHKFRWRTLLPAVAVYAGLNITGKNNPYTFTDDTSSPKVMLITHNGFGKWMWVNNFIYDKIGTEYPSYGWITTFTRGFNSAWSGFLEFQAYKSDYYADGVARVGAAYLLSMNMQVDASISSNIKNTPMLLYGGVGFSWRFDGFYKDVLLPGKGDRENLLEEDQKKQEDEKERRKKEREELLDEPIDEPSGDPAPADPSNP
ncbi:transporter [Flavobacterium sp. Sd200]|uniref:transporter n=1 Tax=Flavobacterium sp. Sd200 TaxID=2692211 RepID=UPI001367D381|nr:transporter [Flavobacterium sp. Sd200]MXN93142.1 transporter [Flavobacterium sp. Sd200]